MSSATATSTEPFANDGTASTTSMATNSAQLNQFVLIVAVLVAATVLLLLVVVVLAVVLLCRYRRGRKGQRRGRRRRPRRGLEEDDYEDDYADEDGEDSDDYGSVEGGRGRRGALLSRPRPRRYGNGPRGGRRRPDVSGPIGPVIGASSNYMNSGAGGREAMGSMDMYHIDDSPDAGVGGFIAISRPAEGLRKDSFAARQLRFEVGDGERAPTVERRRTTLLPNPSRRLSSNSESNVPAVRTAPRKTLGGDSGREAWVSRAYSYAFRKSAANPSRSSSVNSFSSSSSKRRSPLRSTIHPTYSTNAPAPRRSRKVPRRSSSLIDPAALARLRIPTEPLPAPLPSTSQPAPPQPAITTGPNPPPRTQTSTQQPRVPTTPPRLPAVPSTVGSSYSTLVGSYFPPMPAVGAATPLRKRTTTPSPGSEGTALSSALASSGGVAYPSPMMSPPPTGPLPPTPVGLPTRVRSIKQLQQLGDSLLGPQRQGSTGKSLRVEIPSWVIEEDEKGLLMP
ncbi:hypothetical protein HK101_005010, partial [Irineochytrium annulatum]